MKKYIISISLNMKQLFVCLLICIITTTIAQERSFHLYDIGERDVAWQMCEAENSELVIVGQGLFPNQNGTLVWTGMIYKTNSIGEVIMYQMYNPDLCSEINSILYLEESNSYLIAAKSSDGALLFLTLDANLNITKIITPEESILATHCRVVVVENSIIFYGAYIASFGKSGESDDLKIQSKQELRVEKRLNKESDQAIHMPYFVAVDRQTLEITHTNSYPLDYFGDIFFHFCDQLLVSPENDNLYAIISAVPYDFTWGYISYISANLALVKLDENFDISEIKQVVDAQTNWFHYSACYYNNKLAVASYLSKYTYVVPPGIVNHEEILSSLIKFMDTTSGETLDSLIVGHGSEVNNLMSRPATFNAVLEHEGFCYFASTDSVSRYNIMTHSGWSNNITLNCFDENLDCIWEKFYRYEETYLFANQMVSLSNGNIAICGLAHSIKDSGEDTDFLLLIVDAEGNVAVEDSPIVVSETLAYPNPTESQINIRVAIQHKNCTIELYNMSGALLKTEKANSGITTLDISAFPSGNYIYKVYNGAGFVESGKFVKGF